MRKDMKKRFSLSYLMERNHFYVTFVARVFVYPAPYADIKLFILLIVHIDAQCVINHLIALRH